jgi:hypothetical protein
MLSQNPNLLYEERTCPSVCYCCIIREQITCRSRQYLFIYLSSWLHLVNCPQSLLTLLRPNSQFLTGAITSRLWQRVVVPGSVPGYIGWRAGTTTLCHSRLYPLSQGLRIWQLYAAIKKSLQAYFLSVPRISCENGIAGHRHSIIRHIRPSSEYSGTGLVPASAFWVFRNLCERMPDSPAFRHFKKVERDTPCKSIHGCCWCYT